MLQHYTHILKARMYTNISAEIYVALKLIFKVKVKKLYSRNNY